MSKFYVPQRFDESKKDEGVWFSIDDAAGRHYGRFKCKFLDQHSQQGELAMKRIRIRHGAAIKTGNAYDALKFVLVEGCMVDWELPTDPRDKKAEKVPFSIANALEYFSMEETKWILFELSKLVDDVSHFAPEEAEELEEVEKN